MRKTPNPKTAESRATLFSLKPKSPQCKKIQTKGGTSQPGRQQADRHAGHGTPVVGGRRVPPSPGLLTLSFSFLFLWDEKRQRVGPPRGPHAQHKRGSFLFQARLFGQKTVPPRYALDPVGNTKEERCFWTRSRPSVRGEMYAPRPPLQIPSSSAAVLRVISPLASQSAWHLKVPCPTKLVRCRWEEGTLCYKLFMGEPLLFNEERRSSLAETIRFVNPNLNPGQAAAIMNALCAESLAIVDGPPGNCPNRMNDRSLH